VAEIFPDVSRETAERLEHYAALLRKWNPAINLVAPGTLDTVMTRHIADSAQVAALAPEGWGHWVDLGSGGGFPGMVVAILAAEQLGKQVTLVESDQRKAAFLRSVARETGVAARVMASRIEALAPQEADIVSARALAPLPALIGLAAPHLRDGGCALFHKGAEWKKELEEARSQWRFEARSHKSRTHESAVILELKELAHV
jgi:16S rRNA (guanine527-N7)-methyltransferase